MRMGRNPKRRRTKPKANNGDAAHTRTLAVGQISSNVIETLYGPLLVELATKSVENYANEMLHWSSVIAQSPTIHTDGAEVPTDQNGEGEEVQQLQVNPDGTFVHQDTPNTPASNHQNQHIPPPPPPPPLFSTQSTLDTLTTLLHDTSTHFTSTPWKIHANAAKFERLLNEKYGRFRPFVESYPQIETILKRLQRRYVMGDFSPLRKERPMGLSSSVMLLFMLHRNQCPWMVVMLVGLFTVVGLQPWALVMLVCVGRYGVEGRRRRMVGGMTRKKNGRLMVVEGYYHVHHVEVRGEGGKDDVEEEEEDEEGLLRRYKYSILNRPVGKKFNPADLTLRDERFDIICLGTGVEVLYCAALLARSGKAVCVLCPTEDGSGCVSMESDGDKTWGPHVPFDIQNHNVAYVSKQQSLLAPALCTSTDTQGGIRFARIGSKVDGYAHSILSVPGLGTNSLKYEDIEPVVLNAQGGRALAEYCYDVLGDGYPNILDVEGNDDGSSTSLSYLKACTQINAGAGAYYLSRLYPPNSSSEAAFKSPEFDAYRESTLRSASQFLNKCLPLHPHVRSLMGAIGMMNENIRPDKTCMAAHVSNVCAMTSEQGLSYPIGGPRALCHALSSVIEQCGGRVVTGVNLQELLFDTTTPEKEREVEAEKANNDKKVVPRCRGIRLENGMEVNTTSDGSVISFLGFIPTFLHLLTPEVRTSDGVPIGLPALSERRPLMKVLVGIKGTKEDLNLTGADWYRLPNATVPRDELDANGQVEFGTIGVDDGSDDSDEAVTIEALVEENEADDETAVTALGGKRGKRSKNSSSAGTTTKAPPRVKFTSGVSWMKVSFPSAKDPSWKDRHGAITTCVVTVEADDDFVKMFDTKPKVYSLLKKSTGDVERLRDRVLKDLVDAFPQLQGKTIDGVAVVGPIRAGLTHDPPKFAIKGNRPKTPYPGLFIGGADLTVGDSFSGSIAGAWLAANAIMGYSFIDQLYLGKNITSDLAQFLEEPNMAVERNGEIVEDLAVPFTNDEAVDDDDKESEPTEAVSGMGASAAESSKEE